MRDFYRVSKSELYERDIGIVKKYRDDYFRVTLHKALRRKGYEAIDGDGGKGTKNTAGNIEKLNNSISRTKSKIFELAMCNDWEYFITLTINSELHDRNDLKNYKKKLSKWLNNYNNYNRISMQYLLIFENHHVKNDAYHAHGFLRGLPHEHLNEFTLKDKLPMKMIIKLKQGQKIYNWEKYAKAFGYVSLEPIICAEAISKYVTSTYLSKDIFKTKIDLNDHFYISSQGLQRAEIIYRNTMTREFKPDFENEYIKIKTERTFEDAIKYFVDDNE